jgi:hypothetical protein
MRDRDNMDYLIAAIGLLTIAGILHIIAVKTSVDAVIMAKADCMCSEDSQ